LKLFKKRQKERMLSEPNSFFGEMNTEELLLEYNKLGELFKVDNSEEVRLRMVEISEKINSVVTIKEKKPFKLFNKKQKYEEKYCHTCKHNLILHHKKGKSTGCRKCGCLRTIDEIMNPTDNGHKDAVIKLDIAEDKI